MTTRTYSPLDVPRRAYQPLAYVAGLDGLRAIAVLAVLAYHLDWAWADGGYLGVEAFFVISGFLITRLMLDERRRDGAIDRREFWRRRARRLLPAAVVVIVGVLVWSALVLPAGELRRFRADGVASLFYVENWKLILAREPYFSTLGRPSPLRHLWSLAIEEQFYVLWPLVLPLLARRFRRRTVGWIIVAAGVASAARMVALADIGAPERAYYGTDTRAFGILFGAALACWLPTVLSAEIGDRARRTIGRASMAALAVLAWQFATRSEFDPWTYPWGFLVVDAATLVLIVSCLHPASTIGTRLGARPLAALGRRSYSLYLWHWPVIVVTRPGVDWGLTGTTALIARLAIIAALSEASYRFVEQPFRDGRHPARIRRAIASVRRSGWWGPVLATTILVTVALAGFVVNAPGASDQPLARASVEVAAPPNPTTVAPTVPPTTATPSAPAGALLPGLAITTTTTMPVPTTPPPPPPTVTLIGESVMLGAAPALSERYGDRLRLDAVEGRAFNDSVAALETINASGAVGDVVVVHLGNNGAVPPGALDRILAVAGPRPLVLLTVHVPRRWEAQVNDEVRRFADAHDTVRLQDWKAVATAEPGLLIADGVHLTDAGQLRYADLVVGATG